jgi:hypothetical protein
VTEESDRTERSPLPAELPPEHEVEYHREFKRGAALLVATSCGALAGVVASFHKLHSTGFPGTAAQVIPTLLLVLAFGQRAFLLRGAFGSSRGRTDPLSPRERLADYVAVIAMAVVAAAEAWAAWQASQDRPLGQVGGGLVIGTIVGLSVSAVQLALVAADR